MESLNSGVQSALIDVAGGLKQSAKTRDPVLQQLQTVCNKLLHNIEPGEGNMPLDEAIRCFVLLMIFEGDIEFELPQILAAEYTHSPKQNTMNIEALVTPLKVATYLTGALNIESLPFISVDFHNKNEKVLQVLVRDNEVSRVFFIYLSANVQRDFPLKQVLSKFERRDYFGSLIELNNMFKAKENQAIKKDVISSIKKLMLRISGISVQACEFAEKATAQEKNWNLRNLVCQYLQFFKHPWYQGQPNLWIASLNIRAIDVHKLNLSGLDINDKNQIFLSSHGDEDLGDVHFKLKKMINRQILFLPPFMELLSYMGVIGIDYRRPDEVNGLDHPSPFVQIGPKEIWAHQGPGKADAGNAKARAKIAVTLLNALTDTKNHVY